MRGDWPPPGLYVARAMCGTIVVLTVREWTSKCSRPCIAPFVSWFAIEMN